MRIIIFFFILLFIPHLQAMEKGKESTQSNEKLGRFLVKEPQIIDDFSKVNLVSEHYDPSASSVAQELQKMDRVSRLAILMQTLQTLHRKERIQITYSAALSAYVEQDTKRLFQTKNNTYSTYVFSELTGDEYLMSEPLCRLIAESRKTNKPIGQPATPRSTILSSSIFFQNAPTDEQPPLTKPQPHSLRLEVEEVLSPKNAPAKKTSHCGKCTIL